MNIEVGTLNFVQVAAHRIAARSYSFSLFDAVPFWLIPTFVAPQRFYARTSEQAGNKKGKEIANGPDG
jgi:hypothetical protein